MTPLSTGPETTSPRAARTPEPLFELSAEYQEMLHQGLRVSGEQSDFFIEGRIASLIGRLPTGFRVRRILDYGCGVGTTSVHLARAFSDAEIVGVDIARNAIAAATELFGNERVSFFDAGSLSDLGEFDLCYVNGVFHHVDSEQHPAVAAAIHRALRPGGCFALFENNPWNVGTRIVMSRIPFDRDAELISLFRSKRLLRDAGFSGRIETWSLFYFPHFLGWLRPMEPFLAGLPLGAQYCVLAAR